MYIIKKEKGIDMNRKNVKLTVKQHNLLEDKNDTIFKGTAQLDTSENHKVYYQEADKTTVILKTDNIITVTAGRRKAIRLPVMSNQPVPIRHLIMKVIIAVVLQIQIVVATAAVNLPAVL